MRMQMSSKVAKKKRKLAYIITLSIMVIIVTIYWWHWQAPYRKLRLFLRALEVGDIQTLYNLTPKRYERQICGLTLELIDKTYQQVLKPLFREYRLVSIRRTSRSSPIPEIWIRSYVVPFRLRFHNSQGKTLFTVAEVIWYREEVWTVPWGIFVWKLLIAAYGREQADVLMVGLGYDLIHGPHPGDVLSVKRDLSLIRTGKIKPHQ
jgi:hypothetical protein